MLVPKVISKFSFLVFLSFVQCKPEASKDEFISMYTKLSDSRINFRTNMKALGDSSYSHQDYAMRAMDEVNRDSTFESGISENYKAYNDSLKDRLTYEKHHADAKKGKARRDQQFKKLH